MSCKKGDFWICPPNLSNVDALCVANNAGLVNFFARDSDLSRSGDSVPIRNAISDTILLAGLRYFATLLRRIVFVGEPAFCLRLDHSLLFPSPASFGCMAAGRGDQQHAYSGDRGALRCAGWLRHDY
jgi:hypothetical protein